MIILQNFLDFLIPPRCLICNHIVLDAGQVCAHCFKQLHFIELPYCRLCARPFASQDEAGKKDICLDCDTSYVPWQHCRAAFVYNEGFKKLIMPLKYGDQQKSLQFLSYFMYRSAQDLIAKADYIMPVPLHKKRLRYRKYNQSALLAWQLGRKGNTRVLPMGLMRIKETIVLGHLSKKERRVLLQNAFIVHPKYKQYLENKRIILVDDVMTTGSTMAECVETLLKAGAKHIDIIAAAKVS
ncbi:double zinc ribbon domain-containing protein [Commensalibacter communis]|uniref:double zinc ribbon domain-containing protein n=1 Tax=Commensalibacter communis TaxID=2972786 RepID=UPI0030EC6FAF